MQCVGSSSGVQSYSDVAHSAPCSSPLCSFACRRAASFPVANGTFRPSSLKERSKSESEALNRFDYRLSSSFIDLVPLHLWQHKVHTADPPHTSSSDSEDDASSGVSSSDAADENIDYLGFEFTDKDGFSTHTIVSTGRPKKSVRFADDCGGDLETVRVMTEPSDYPPRISPSVLRRLRGESGEHMAEVQDCATWIVPFKQPASEYVRFREHLDSGKVALENVMLKNDVCKMTGTIKVVNIAFEKRVFLRITDNGWKNFLDRPATFQPSSSKTYDTFSFDIDIPRNTKPDSKIEFCICYVAASTEYWDSNDGANYVLVSPPPSVEPSTPPPAKPERNKDVDDAYRLSYDDWTKFGSWKSLSTDGPYW
uniref:CBM21 domain-containing protein n=1 Tax=Steinernema glaseri TaxID=37863 RepID=A0A1I7Z2Z8_9BILA